MYIYVDLIVLSVGFFTGAAALDCFSSTKDICSAEIPGIPNLSSRDPTFVMTTETSHWTFCDVYSINISQWYRSKTLMSTSCPSMYMCGTKFPIWMNGQNPEPTEGVVNRTSCLKDFDSCCLNSYRLTAVNCKEYMAYCFVDLPSSCHQRYCFDYSSASTTAAQQTATNATSTTMELESTTEIQTSYPTTTVKYEGTKLSSASVKYTSTKGDSSVMTYPSTTTKQEKTSGIVTEFIDTSTNGEKSKTSTHEHYSSESTTAPQQTATKSTITTTVLESTTEIQTKYPTTTVKHEGPTLSSTSVKFTSTSEDTSFMTYPSTTTSPEKTSGSDTKFIDTSTNGDKSNTTTQETPADDHDLLIITISIIGLMVAVICGLLIVIFWRRRMPKVTDETDKTKVYETLKSPDTKTSNEGEHVYRIVSFDNSEPAVQIEGKLGNYYSNFQSCKSYCANVDYQFANTERVHYDEDEHYVTLP
ncbi:mucin-22-like [Ruditapes philippinarum]|uniref:mucin-22-like n=1 Tax=Ruditapes philippinarum TaxID=129788 RepID=UPI00295BE2E5|nr:mucin-22-like [Ruditapes philippinarum]